MRWPVLLSMLTACTWGALEPQPTPAEESPEPEAAERQLCVVRHGEAHKNLGVPIEELPRGAWDSLTEAGQEQAREAGASLPRPVGMLISSPTGRTVQTAELFELELTVQLDARSFELGGDAPFQDRLDAAQRGEDLQPEHGESFELGAIRQRALLEYLREATPKGHHAVVVTHGDVGPLLVGEALGTPLLERPTKHGLSLGQVRCVSLGQG